MFTTHNFCELPLCVKQDVGFADKRVTFLIVYIQRSPVSLKQSCVGVAVTQPCAFLQISKKLLKHRYLLFHLFNLLGLSNCFTPYCDYSPSYFSFQIGQHFIPFTSFYLPAFFSILSSFSNHHPETFFSFFSLMLTAGQMLIAISWKQFPTLLFLWQSSTVYSGVGLRLPFASWWSAASLSWDLEPFTILSQAIGLVLVLPQIHRAPTLLCLWIHALVSPLSALLHSLLCNWSNFQTYLCCSELQWLSKDYFVCHQLLEIPPDLLMRWVFPSLNAIMMKGKDFGFRQMWIPDPVLSFSKWRNLSKHSDFLNL